MNENRLYCGEITQLVDNLKNRHKYLKYVKHKAGQHEKKHRFLPQFPNFS